MAVEVACFLRIVRFVEDDIAIGRVRIEEGQGDEVNEAMVEGIVSMPSL
jgi:hypothetical protein